MNNFILYFNKHVLYSDTIYIFLETKIFKKILAMNYQKLTDMNLIYPI